MYRTYLLKRVVALSHRLRTLMTMSLIAGLSLACCYGQAGRGAISGTVTDSANALVAGAAVSLTATATNTVRTMTTGPSGLYTFSALVPGAYNLTVDRAGFDKSINQAILIEADRVTTVDVHLSPGQQTQTVNVSATEAPLLNTTDSTVSTEIDNKTIESVPLNGRDLFFLAQLSASVIPANGSLNSTGESNRPGLGISAFRINGLQEGSLTYILDGSPLTVLGYGTSSSSPAFTPTLDGTQEFRLETSNSPATAPSSGSGVMSLVSKSGTDKLHGSAFFFERPNSLDANDPFNKAAQLDAGTANTPPPFQRKQWGGSIGGPIRKDKLFYFGDYEGTRASGVYTETTTVPTAAEKTGDFSDVPTIYNPFDVDATGKRVPFGSNQIPASLQDPVALNMSKYYPAPNAAGEGPYHINNYFDASSYPDNADKFDVRLDYYLNTRQTIFGRYSFADTTFGAPDHFHNGGDPGYYLNDTRGQNVLMAYNFTVNPTTLFQVRYSFLRHAENQPPPAQLASTSLSSLGFAPSLAAEQTLKALPDIGVSGLSGVGSMTYAMGFKFVSMNHDVIVSLEKNKGRHDIKVGFEYRKDLENLGQPIAPNGSYSFDTTATSSTTYGNDGYGYASFLMGMGNPSEGQSFTQDIFTAESSPYFAPYAEDTFRITPNLTVVAGLRWDVFGGRNERYNRLEYFDPTAAYTVNGDSLTGGEVFVRNGGSPFTSNWKNFGPRLSVSYRLSDRMVAHAGGGIFYGPSARSVGLSAGDSDSFSGQTNWQATTLDQYGNSHLLNPLSNPFPSGLVPLSKGSLGLATNLGTSLQTVPHSQPDASAYNWNAGWQYAFGNNISISADYVGSRGLHQSIGNGGSGPPLNELSLQQIGQYNTQLGTSIANPFVNAVTNPSAPFYKSPTIPFWQAVAPFPQFASGSPGGGVNLNSLPLLDSNYNALIVKAEKRLSTHFTTQASFTWAKTISDGSNGPYSYVLSNTGYQDWHNLNLERSVDAQDVSKAFSWFVLYDLPVGRGRALDPGSRWANAIVGGWAVNTVLSLTTGVPIVTGGSFPNQSIYFNQRPDLTCDPASGAQHNRSQWFLPNCFAAPASPYVAGSAPRTLSDVRADGTHNLDLSAVKNFGVGEGRNLQVRADFFNFTNSVQLGIPNSNWNPNNLSGFGQVTSAASTPRQVQLGARFTF